MKSKGLKASFFTFYNAALGIVIEIFATVILMAAAFFVGILILSYVS